MSNKSAVIELTQVPASSLFLTYLRWDAHSKVILDQAETTILSSVKVPFERLFVSLGQCVGNNDEIWTLKMNTKSSNVPIVLLHGFGAGIAFFVMNIEEISQNRPLYAIDLLGFGKSSRPTFSQEPQEIEKQFVDSIEKWREIMQIPKMILLGHSFGGFLATSYSMKYPERIEHLILADPWGFTEPSDLRNYSFWRRSLIRSFHRISPLSMVRFAGPFGEWLVKKGQPDIMKKLEHFVEDQRVIAQYVHQCNSNRNSSGEAAFYRLLNGPWAKHPIGERLSQTVNDNMPITFLYGAKSWMNNSYGPIIQKKRPDSYTHIEYIEHAGHNVFSDNAKDFNRFVNDACKVLKSKDI